MTTAPKKNVTMQMIADELGISQMTVSRALNPKSKDYISPETREKIVRVADKLGYTPNLIAKSLVNNKTYTIGVVVPDLSYSFYPDVIKGINKIATDQDYQIILCITYEDFKNEEKALQTLMSMRVDGILLAQSQSVKDFSLYKKIIQSGLPLVFFDRYVLNLGASCVGSQDEQGAEEICNYLIKKGKKRIAHLSGPDALSVSLNRQKGYKKALKDNGIRFDKSLIIPSGFREDDGYQSMKQFLKEGKKLPEAIVSVNDASAIGAMTALKEQGYKIPEDLVIVGFSDDSRAKFSDINLTTVNVPAYEIGIKASEILIKKISTENSETENVFLETSLVIRNSTF
ncbi:MAG: LacI family DNA-binding transcriptional regulator [Rhodothermaceae bacterium]